MISMSSVYRASSISSWKEWALVSLPSLPKISTYSQLILPEIPVYLSVDIDVLDPGIAPGTGTPEPGGWTTRELIQILRGIEDLNLVGGDIVEVSPAYESGQGEGTALAGAQVVFEILTSMVKLVASEERRRFTADVMNRRGLKDRGDWVEGAVKKPGRVISKAKKGVVGAVKEGVEKVLQVVRDEL